MSTLVSKSRIRLKVSLKILFSLIGQISRPFYTVEGIRVLFYHRVNNHDFKSLDLVSRECTVPAREFSKQMEYLKKKGYQSLSLSEFEALMQDPNIDYKKKKYVLITFDDGYEDNVEVALPILKQFGMKATLYVPNGYIGKSSKDIYNIENGDRLGRFVTNQQVKNWLEEGCDLGSHTYNHSYLGKLNSKEFPKELQDSKNGLERNYNVAVTSIAYPGGEYNEKVLEESKVANYSLGFTTMTGVNTSQSPKLELRRTEISVSDTFYIFKQKMAGHLDWMSFKDGPFFRKLMNNITGLLLLILEKKKK